MFYFKNGKKRFQLKIICHTRTKISNLMKRQSKDINTLMTELLELPAKDFEYTLIKPSNYKHIWTHLKQMKKWKDSANRRTK